MGNIVSDRPFCSHFKLIPSARIRPSHLQFLASISCAYHNRFRHLNFLLRYPIFWLSLRNPVLQTSHRGPFQQRQLSLKLSSPKAKRKDPATACRSQYSLKPDLHCHFFHRWQCLHLFSGRSEGCTTPKLRSPCSGCRSFSGIQVGQELSVRWSSWLIGAHCRRPDWKERQCDDNRSCCSRLQLARIYRARCEYWD